MSDKNTKLTSIVKKSISEAKKIQKEEKLREMLRPIIKEVMAEEKSKKLEEGFLTTGWASLKASLDKAADFNAKKSTLEKAISKANTKFKGAWLNKIKAANDENAINAIIADLDKRPGKDIEDKLAGKTATGAGTGAIFRENKK